MSVSQRLMFAVLVLITTACKKDTIVTPVEDLPTVAPSLNINFKALANNSVLVPNSKWYTNVSQDSFTVTKFNYYISNIKLTRSDGTVFTEPESYHLIRHVEGSTSFTINNLPEGNYTAMEFLIGVDSLRNVSGAQTGALDVANVMFWDWNTGYIFFKLEGNYRSSVTHGQDYTIHIGGFSGKYSCLQKCKLSFANPVVAQANKQSGLYINSHVDEIFKSPTTLSFDDYYASINLPMFQSISLNYKDMFVVDRIEN